jgi:rhodanese-related sulfurtransferase
MYGAGIAYDKATSIPYSHLAAYVDDLMEEKMIVVYCQSGRTSTYGSHFTGRLQPAAGV